MRINELFEEADNAFKKGNYVRAYNFYERAKKQVYSNESRLCESEGDFDRAYHYAIAAGKINRAFNMLKKTRDPKKIEDVLEDERGKVESVMTTKKILLKKRRNYEAGR